MEGSAEAAAVQGAIEQFLVTACGKTETDDDGDFVVFDRSSVGSTIPPWPPTGTRLAQCRP